MPIKCGDHPDVDAVWWYEMVQVRTWTPVRHHYCEACKARLEKGLAENGFPPVEWKRV